MTKNNEQMAALREQINKIVDAEFYSPHAEPVVKRVERIMQLITTTQAEAVREARIALLNKYCYPETMTQPYNPLDAMHEELTSLKENPNA